MPETQIFSIKIHRGAGIYKVYLSEGTKHD